MVSTSSDPINIHVKYIFFASICVGILQELRTFREQECIFFFSNLSFLDIWKCYFNYVFHPFKNVIFYLWLEQTLNKLLFLTFWEIFKKKQSYSNCLSVQNTEAHLGDVADVCGNFLNGHHLEKEICVFGLSVTSKASSSISLNILNSLIENNLYWRKHLLYIFHNDICLDWAIFLLLAVLILCKLASKPLTFSGCSLDLLTSKHC